MQGIFSSEWFYDEKNIGTKIKSPVELIAGLMRHLNAKNSSTKGILGLERALGQVLFKPPNVAGWPGGKNWIDNSTLMMRLNLGGVIIRASDLDFNLKNEAEQSGSKKLNKLELTLDFQPVFNMTARKNEDAVVETLADYLIQAPLPVSTKTIQGFAKSSDKNKFIKKICIRLMSLPEYQMC